MSAPTTLDDIRVDYAAPAHVPKDRIVDLSFAMGSQPNDLVDPYEPCGWLAGPDIPRLLFNPPTGQGLGAVTGGQLGSWAVTHHADIQRVYTDDEHFSNKGTAEFQSLIGETFPSIPLAIDPPDHRKYRVFLQPHFAPARLNLMRENIRALVNEMIDEFIDKREVDIAWDFGRVYPVRIFMGLMGFPHAMFEQFLDWEWDILHSGSLEKMQASLKGVLEYLRNFMAEREKDPDDNLVSKIIHGQIEGRPLTEDEKIGIVWFLWLGGLDTVAATISQMYRRMALEPAIQQQLRNDPSLINTGVEEFLRTQPLLSSTRTVCKTFEWHGVTLHKGDKVQCINPAGNFDPAEFDNPRKFDPTRRANRHFTFVGGIHRCLGAPLARMELRVLLEEWFKRVPEFGIKPAADTTIFPGLLSIRNLHLAW